MKKKKYGFSLAELLIAMGIISIVIVMAISITKKGIENAYNDFYYTGYKSLYEAISEALDEGYELGESQNSGNWSVNNSNTQEFINYIAEDLFDAKCKDDSDTTNNKCTIISTQASQSIQIYNTSNGIIYTFQSMLWNPIANFKNMIIYMTVPAPRKKVTIGTDKKVRIANTVQLLYADKDGGMLIPLGGAFMYPNGYKPSALGDNANEVVGTVNLAQRKDLLPFYLNDGKSGTVNQYFDKASNVFVIPNSESHELKFKPRQFYSFKDAYCTKYGSGGTISMMLGGNSRNVLDCYGYSPTEAVKNYPIEFENPKKVF